MTYNRRVIALFAALFPLASGACSHAASSSDANAAVYDAWRERRSHIEVTAEGSVARYLGMRAGRVGTHEGFLLHLRGSEGHGLTVKVEDNVDLTGPVPIREGDDVEARGEYIYDPRGGIIHYTHRDPHGRHAPGYIRAHGKTYS